MRWLLFFIWIRVVLLLSTTTIDPNNANKNNDTLVPEAATTCNHLANLPIKFWILEAFIVVMVGALMFFLGTLFSRCSSYDKAQSPKAVQKKRGTKRQRPVLKARRSPGKQNRSIESTSRSSAGRSPTHYVSAKRKRSCPAKPIRAAAPEKIEDVVALFRWIFEVDDLKYLTTPRHTRITPILTSFTDTTMLAYFKDGRRILDILNLLFNTRLIYGDTAEDTHFYARMMLRNRRIHEYDWKDIYYGRSFKDLKVALSELFIMRKEFDLCGLFYKPELKDWIREITERKRRKRAGKKVLKMLLKKFKLEPRYYHAYQLIWKTGKRIVEFEEFLKLVTYCGKGIGRRAETHAIEAYMEGDDRTGYRKNDAIKLMWENDQEVGICIYEKQLPEKVALIVESALIATMSLNELCNIRAGENIEVLSVEQQTNLAIYVLWLQFETYRKSCPGLSKEQVEKIVERRGEKKSQKTEPTEDTDEESV